MTRQNVCTRSSASSSKSRAEAVLLAGGGENVYEAGGWGVAYKSHLLWNCPSAPAVVLACSIVKLALLLHLGLNVPAAWCRAAWFLPPPGQWRCPSLHQSLSASGRLEPGPWEPFATLPCGFSWLCPLTCKASRPTRPLCALFDLQSCQTCLPQLAYLTPESSVCGCIYTELQSMLYIKCVRDHVSSWRCEDAWSGCTGSAKVGLQLEASSNKASDLSPPLAVARTGSSEAGASLLRSLTGQLRSLAALRERKGETLEAEGSALGASPIGLSHSLFLFLWLGHTCCDTSVAVSLATGPLVAARQRLPRVQVSRAPRGEATCLVGRADASLCPPAGGVGPVTSPALFCRSWRECL